jgi:lipoprotein signal peptidase
MVIIGIAKARRVMFEALRRHKLDLLLVLILVLIDTGTKVAAYAVLPPGNWPLGVGDDLSLLLSLNEMGVAVSPSDVFAKYPSMPIAQAIAMLAMSVVVIALARSEIRRGFGVLAGIGSLLVLVLGSVFLAEVLPKVFDDQRHSVILMRASSLVLLLVLIMCSRTLYFRACFTVMAAAGAGNLLSFFYPPFAIVDFIRSRWMCEVIDMGVFNVADLYFLLSCIMLLAAPAYLLVRFIVKRWKRPVEPATPL